MRCSSFRNLDAWRAARRLVKPVYALTSRFPSSEKYCLVLQMRKAVHSSHSNIAEGSGRLSLGEWQQFLGQSRGSLLELESQLISAWDLEYATAETARDLSEKIRDAVRLVNGLLRASARTPFKARKYKPPP